MNFRKINNITGWIICIIACATYILTAEPTVSFWDTGEFIAAADKLQLPHPPGAPTFLLLGRVFIVLFGDNPMTAAKAVNILSAIVSGFTILFLFWTITHFARKMFIKVGEQLTSQQIFTVMASGVVGALAYTFSDSFWFSAVEGEVYSLSSFFTALVFWAMLKWEHADEHAGNDYAARTRADRWIVFIFFMMGLSIGVHLLNLLTIPAIVMIFYFRRYKYTLKGAIWAFIIGCIITGVVQVVLIKWSVQIAGKFDILFVNSFGLPFFSGFIFFFALLAALIWLGLRWANRNGWSFLRLGLWCFIFMLVGYSTYITTMIRSNAIPSMDMNNVDNPMTLVYYLGRDQYGSQPLLYGPHFAADFVDDDGDGFIDFKEKGMKYAKSGNKYIEIGRDMDYKWDKKDMMIFPRIWDRTNEQFHADAYAEWLGLQQYQDQRTGRVDYDDPTYGDNITWFFSYQMGLMYWRYFMWNFSGKQNDIQGFGSKRDGNWISGFSFIDNQRLGDQSKLPDSLKQNNARNTLFLIPFILGMLGCVYQFARNRRDWLVNFVLFFFTGIAVVLYLNQPGNQPRERDYAYVGSFYAFAVWIGLAVVSIFKLIKEKEDKTAFGNTMLWGSIATFFITLMSSAPAPGGAMFMTAILATAVYAAVVAAIYYLLKSISNNGANEKILNIIAAIICMAAPVLMANQEWDDHDRSKKTLARDTAKNYLESCDKNAILFTFGDNDTYPLWYAQEVENVRPDIRIINTSLLGIDWYINQLRYKVNQSDSIDVIWTPEQIQGGNRAMLGYQAVGSKERFYDLYDVMKNVIGKGETPRTFPVKRFKVPVDTALVRKNGTANATDTIYNEMLFEMAKNDLTRDELIILNIIASNGWKRPIYFTSPYTQLGFGQYLRKDGFTYRLVPVKLKDPQLNWVADNAFSMVRMGGTSIRDNNTDFMYKNLMEKFSAGGADRKGVYFDAENRTHILALRGVFAELAGNLADMGRKDEARKLIAKCESMINIENLPYALTSRFNSHNQNNIVYLEACYKAGDTILAEKIRLAIKKDLDQQKRYYDYLKTEKEALFESVRTEEDVNNRMLVVYGAVVKAYDPAKAEQPLIPVNPNIPIPNADTSKVDNTRVDSANKK